MGLLLRSIHICHHPRCTLPVEPRLLACPSHWMELPKSLRDEIWRTYRPGQEINKSPSDEYMAAQDKCIRWWMVH